MQKKWIKIGFLVILIMWMIINLNVSIDSRMNGSSLEMVNIEALASSESGDWYYPCVKAKGFCLINGIKIDGITLITE